MSLTCPKCQSQEINKAAYMEGGVTIEIRCEECGHREEAYIGANDSVETSRRIEENLKAKFAPELTYA